MKNLLSILIFCFILFIGIKAECLAQTKIEIDSLDSKNNFKSSSCDTIKTIRNPFNKGNFIAWQDLVKGRISGVQITPYDGSPGANFSIIMRGAASLNRDEQPLIYLNDMPITFGSDEFGNLLSTINPKDIDSIQFLKNASETVAFGAGAHNGVILINMKEASTRKKLDISFTNAASFSFRKNQIDVLNSDEYRSEMINFLEGNQEDLNLLGNSDTDWQDEVYRTGFGRDHHLSAAGNINKFKYRLGIGLSNKDGVLKKSNYKRNSIHLNISKEFFNSLQLTFNANLSDSQENVGNKEAISDAYSFDPTLPANENSGAYYYHEHYGRWYSMNPLWRINNSKNKLNTKQEYWQLNAKYNLPFIDGLALSGLLSKNITDADRITAFEYSENNYSFYNSEDTHYRSNTNLQKIKLDYDLKLNGFVSKLIGGIYYQNQTIREEFERNLEYGESIIKEWFRPKGELKSYGGMFDIEFLDKYTIGTVYRRNKAKDSDYHIDYSGVYFSWNLGKEGFLNTSSLFDEFTLRASYGLHGKSNIKNKYLVPERHHSTNIGIDFSSFNHRLSTSIEYYHLKHKNVIGLIQIAAGSGYSNSILRNIGYISNKGIELSVFAEPIVSKQLKWLLQFNASYNKNELDRFKANDINHLSLPGNYCITSKLIGQIDT
ncbi:TonB-dependent receptor domain-containing protein [Marinifilum caeruleilacunae]|uniref:TonB-dependent receptor plug domain-containing protein n=1 Tax=Marinifilum caeruleilacunae TaxID=2499076 RepID=A0ABX1WZK2_9BACT|nr:TonB-dependent receptor [Marinifilum caeruleilacunae]NOU61588.1 hypothetical protein [Marinifilum caeruleilacunae]